MSKEMAPKERLDKLSTKQIAIDLFNIVSNGKYDMNNLVNYFDRIDEALAELEELKRDVRRYFALEKRLQYIDKNANTLVEIEDMKQTHRETLMEMFELEVKLLKVGNEDV